MKIEDMKPIFLMVPDDKAILAALGILSIRHGQLDYILRMMIKTLSSLSTEEVLDATKRLGTAELRKWIRSLAKQNFGEGSALLKLQALLERSHRASDKRNNFIHSLWAHELDGNPVIRSDDHQWNLAPSLAEIETLSSEIQTITDELNRARFEGGFVFEAITKKSRKSNSCLLCRQQMRNSCWLGSAASQRPTTRPASGPSFRMNGANSLFGTSTSNAPSA